MLQADAEIISVKFLDHEKTDGKLGNLSGNSVHLAQCIHYKCEGVFVPPYGHIR